VRGEYMSIGMGWKREQGSHRDHRSNCNSG